jgi:DNA adenine methylase
MPPHTHYVEPYGGGLAVLWARDPGDQRFWVADTSSLRGVSEVVNDVSGDLMNFWRTLQDPDAFERFRRIVEAVPFSEPGWEEARDHLADSPGADPVRRAAWFFVLNRQSRTGQMREFTSLTRERTRGGRNAEANAWWNAVRGLPAVHERLSGVVILNRPALAVIHSEDKSGTLFYLDPPYLHETRTSTDAYRHEMSEADHRELLDLVKQCRGKVMLSGYPSELYDTTLAGWNRHTFDIANHAAGGKSKRTMTEVLWCNF